LRERAAAYTRLSTALPDNREDIAPSWDAVAASARLVADLITRGAANDADGLEPTAAEFAAGHRARAPKRRETHHAAAEVTRLLQAQQTSMSNSTTTSSSESSNTSSESSITSGSTASAANVPSEWSTDALERLVLAAMLNAHSVVWTTETGGDGNTVQALFPRVGAMVNHGDEPNAVVVPCRTSTAHCSCCSTCSTLSPVDDTIAPSAVVAGGDDASGCGCCGGGGGGGGGGRSRGGTDSHCGGSCGCVAAKAATDAAPVPSTHGGESKSSCGCTENHDIAGGPRPWLELRSLRPIAPGEEVTIT
jgi:hypothetical protein